MRKIIFKQMQSPGDLVVLTVAIRELKKAYPMDYEIDTITCYPEIFFNNPYINHLPKDDGIEIIDLDYGSYLHRLRKQGLHFADCFLYMINEKLKLEVLGNGLNPDIHLTEYEKNKRLFLDKYNLKKPYWVLNAGIKVDIPLKQYPPYLYQKMIDILKYETDFYCDIVQSGSDHHIHPKLDNVINLVGKTNNLRDYFSLIYHSEGCIGPVSLQMHLAAAFNKPCVVIAGGREEPSWEKYPGHSYLHTIGKLDCCDKEGCWHKNIADCVTIDDKNRFSKCMTMISPELICYEIINY